MTTDLSSPPALPQEGEAGTPNKEEPTQNEVTTTTNTPPHQNGQDTSTPLNQDHQEPAQGTTDASTIDAQKSTETNQPTETNHVNSTQTNHHTESPSSTPPLGTPQELWPATNTRPGTAPPSTTQGSKQAATKHRAMFHMTQLGVAVNVPLTKLLDEADPESGFGFKPGGPQGFISYCKDFDSLEVLPLLPTDLKMAHRFSMNLKSTSIPVPSSSPIQRTESAPGHPGHGTQTGDSPHSRQSSPDVRGRSEKMAFPFRGSTTGIDKLTNRKSTPDLRQDGDRKQLASSAGASNDGSSYKKKKSKSKKKSDNERLARKEEKRRRAHGPPIIVKALNDFPDEALKLIKKTKIPEQQLLDHLGVIVHIIRFRTGFNVRTEEEVSKNKEDKGHSEKTETEETSSVDRSPAGLDTASENQKDLRNSTSGVSTNKPDEALNTSQRQREKNEEFDSDALDSSIIPRGSEDLLSDATEFKKLYKNLQQAGRGGFGSVFVAKSTQDKCDIAIKKLPHSTKKTKRTNFNEIGFLNSCKHSNIVKYYRSHLIDDEIWVVMEYMQGGTLAEAVERYSFAESSVAYVAREMLRALSYLHDHNLVHRDLKSANVMLTVEGKIKLIDFGLCVDFTQRKLCHMAGSPFWMPPEMILGIPHGTPADMWSFAICLLELANGEPPNRKSPVRAMFLAATEGIILPPDKHSSDFTDFLGKCLQIDQTKRATASELLKHPFLNKADTQDTMRKILAQIFISNAISNLDYGL